MNKRICQKNCEKYQLCNINRNCCVKLNLLFSENLNYLETQVTKTSAKKMDKRTIKHVNNQKANSF
jgi:hypothetical protein